MNKQESDILIQLFKEPFISQNVLSDRCGYSIDVVNKCIKSLIKDRYLDKSIHPTNKAKEEIKAKAPKNAIVLAAGFGMRMVPINTQCPKALMEVNGEPLIERIIHQLHEVNVKNIYVVVGFMKDKFEYLKEKYNVQLINNEDYASKNNLHSLALAASYLTNCYIIPGDVWCDRNPFNHHELYSWYMVSDLVDNDSNIRMNRKMELVAVPDKQGGNEMIGICYLEDTKSQVVQEKLKELDGNPNYENQLWEVALYVHDRFIVQARVVSASQVVQINTYEQLRELDEKSNDLKSDAISVISKTLGVSSNEIVNITVLKKGMTNRSFLFTCKDKRYIMRIPGEGTDQLINRKQEADVYKIIDGKNICDDIAYINPKNGYKITEFIEGSRVCDAHNVSDLKACMAKLKDFHEQHLIVNHEFDIFGQIDFYESLWEGTPSIYKDYTKTKENVCSLKSYIDSHIKTKCLTHIDAVCDNFLFTDTGDIRLIDWEYAGMQDPHVDIAMFCIYAMYNKREVDRLINIYFENECPDETRIKIYCYIAACGLLWSNWCEYKRILGVEFGDYSLRQYKYAKDYYKIVKEKLNEGQ